MIVLDVLATLWTLACLFVALMELSSALVAPAGRRAEYVIGSLWLMFLSLPTLAFLIWRHP